MDKFTNEDVNRMLYLIEEGLEQQSEFIVHTDMPTEEATRFLGAEKIITAVTGDPNMGEEDRWYAISIHRLDI